MVHENIKKYRIEKGLSQEELAAKVHVVRQTVSKWETGSSLPNAQLLLELASILEVSVDQLLDVDHGTETRQLTTEIETLKEELNMLRCQGERMKQATKKRNLILFCSLLSMLLALIVRNAWLSLLSTSACILLAVVFLYKNLDVLSPASTTAKQFKILRGTTLFNAFLLILCILAALLSSAGFVALSLDQEKLLAMGVVSLLMIFTGFIAPKLPFTRHTGLRLPWTVQDEDTWKLAHQILGFLSIPLALLYIGCALTMDRFVMVTLAAVLLWIGIPGVISALFYFRKMSGRILGHDL